MSSETIYYFVYKTTNLINGKFYIGVHKTNDLDDGYLGSGRRIRRAINKHGIENFKREIIKFCDTIEEAYELENLIVDESFLLREDTYNLKIGGHGGFDYINSTLTTEQRIKICSLGGIKAFNQKLGMYSLTGEERTYYSKLGAQKCKELGVGVFNPKVRELAVIASKTPEAKQKLKESLKNNSHQQGPTNSQYGTIWIKSDLLKQNTKLPKSAKIPDGWIRGRNMEYETIKLQ